MATWAKGVDFKNSANTARVGGVGIYGTDGTVEKAYLGVGTEPWNNTGLEVTSSTISFKGNKVYHAGDKPTPSEIGAAASSHGTHVTYSTTAPLANGTASAGSASTVARTDHVHPLQTTVSGNAGTATKLATARTINGTSFDGTANITTTQWGTARNISVADSDATNTGTAVSVNGSGNVTLKLPATIKATLTGNASTATTLATARTINGTSFNGSGNITTANWGTARNITIGSTTKSVNGSGNVAWTLSEIGAAAASHTHSYLPLSGGNVTGRLNVGGRCILPPVYNYSNGILINICAAAGQTMVAIHVTGNSYGAGVPINSLFNFYDYTADGGIINASGIHHGYNIGNMTVYRNNGRLYAWIKQPASYQTYNIEIITNGKTIDASLSDAAVHSSGNTDSITITPSQASLNGHTHSYAGSSSAGGAANTAVKLHTARTINGTSFDGSANITTSLWGTARTITIGSTAKSVNGSANVAWTLSEIGAAAASHTHSYLPLSGGTITSTEFGPLTINRSGSTNGAAIKFVNSNGTLGYVGMNGAVNGGLVRYSADTNSSYTVLDTGNYKTHVTPANIGAATSSHTHNYAGSSSAGGNANAAVKLATARTINGTNFDGTANITTANWGTARTLTVGNTGKSVNGSGNISWSLNEIGAMPGSTTSAATAATAGWYRIAQTTSTEQANVMGTFTITAACSGNHSSTVLMSGITYGVNPTIQQLSHTQYNATGISQARIVYHTTYSGNRAYLEVYVPTAAARTITVQLSGNAGWTLVAPSTAGSIPSGYTNKAITLATDRIVSNITGSLSGNASTATTLATARTINGTSFNGSANITTANWGTARTIYIADNAGSNTGTGVSVNGSGNATLKLPATIAATLSGNASTATKLATARTISLGGILKGSASFDGSANITISASANDITTITKSLNVTTSWIDTGITGTNLSTGTYAVQMLVNDGTNTSQYYEYYSGIMSWYADTTNSTDADEILLHKAGHASNGRHVYLRTIRTASSGYLKLQISSTNAFTAASSITFKFKKLI